MFDTYGKMTSLEQLNEKAALLKQEGNLEGLVTLAKENGLCMVDAEWYMEGRKSQLAYLDDAAMGRLRAELDGIDSRDSIMICGMIGMLRQVVRDNTELQKAVMRSDKSSVDCVCKLMEALVQAPDRMPADLTPWGKLAIPDLSQKSVREIVEEYYLEEVQENV